MLDTAEASCRGLLGTKPIDSRRLMTESSSDVRRTMVPPSPTSMSFKDTTGEPRSSHPPPHESQAPSDLPVHRTLMVESASCPAGRSAALPPSPLETRHFTTAVPPGWPGPCEDVPLGRGMAC